jgi:hypothetical protein
MKQALALLFAFLLAIVILPVSGNADGYEGSPFTVEIILPDNNIGSVGYYHVPGEPGERITLKAKLINLTDEPLKIKAMPLDAYSGPEGIFYQSPDEVDSNTYSLVDEKYGVAQYITTADLVTLQPKQSEEVEIYIAVPDINRGTLLGSIRFVVFTGTQEVQIEGQNNSSILIDKYKAIDTAIQIDLPEEDQTSIKVGEPDFIENSTDLGVTILNEAAIIEENIYGTYQIKDKRNNVIYEGSIDAFKMAPMTKFKYLIPWGDKPFEPGTYTLYIEMNANGRIMNYEIALETENKPVSPDEGNTAENTDDSQTGSNEVIPQNSLRTFFLIALAGIVVIFALLIFLSYRRSRKTNR